MRIVDAPLGAFDRDEVLLSEPNRDRLAVDFGRAKTKKKVLSFNFNMCLICLTRFGHYNSILHRHDQQSEILFLSILCPPSNRSMIEIESLTFLFTLD